MPNRALFIIADGAHAKFVVRSPETGNFVTVREIDGSERLRTLRAELQASPLATGHESLSPTRRSVGATGYIRQAKEAFVREVADLAAGSFAEQARDGVVLVAPARLIGIMRAHLEGRVKTVGVLRKDLVKVPDRDLHDHLSRFLGAFAA